MKVYKGFNKNLKCRDFQYEVGQEYIHKGEIEVCKSGFHAWKNPFGALSSYSPGKNSRYCEVEGSDKVDERENKVAFEKIKIIREFNLFELIREGINFYISKVKFNKETEKIKDHFIASSKGNFSGIRTLGSYSSANILGENSAAITEDIYSHASVVGKYSAASVEGSYSSSSVIGDYSGASTRYLWSSANVIGEYSGAKSVESHSIATAIGNNSIASTHGYASSAVISGDFAVANAQNYYSSANAIGYESSANVEGACSIASAVGYDSKASACKNSLAVSINEHPRAKGELGAYLILAECIKDEESKYKQNKINKVKCVKVDGKRIKADTWYTLKNGRIIKANDKIMK